MFEFVKEVEPFVIRNEVNGDEVYKRYLLDKSRIVCEKFEDDLCSKYCNGYMGYGCKQFPPDYYKGISGYSGYDGKPKLIIGL